jgi:hypothetical protein
MRGVKAVLGVVMLGGVLFAATTASAMSMPMGGPVHVFVTPSPDGIHGPIVITGAIGDHGQTLTMDKNGKANANGNYVRITLAKGTFEINSTALNAKTKNGQPAVDKATCSFLFTGVGPVTLFNGTGLYKGISGTVNITLTFAGIGAVYKTGKHMGQCNMSNNAPTIAQYSSIMGTGTVKYS